MAEDQKQSFRDRAFEEYKDARESIKRVAALLREKDIDEIEDYRDPLSCDERREITILLSMGGPADGFTVYFDKDGDPVEGYYFFADWFEYEQFKLSSEELDSVLVVYPVSPNL